MCTCVCTRVYMMWVGYVWCMYMRARVCMCVYMCVLCAMCVVCALCVVTCSLKTSNPKAGTLISNFGKIFFFLNSQSPESAKIQFK